MTPPFLGMLKSLMNTALQLLERTFFRYLVAGGLTFLINILAVWFCIVPLGLNVNELQRNLAHLIGTEISILFSYHAHRYWTWRNETKHYLVGIIQFHLFTGLTILLRQIGFYLMDSAGFHWFFSTLVPLTVAVIMNFLGYDRIIFSKIPGATGRLGERRM